MIDFITTNPDNLLIEAVSRYESVSGETLYPGDEHYLFLSQMLQLIVACREGINTAANQNLLRYCTGVILDEYGSQYDITRMEAKTAFASMKFILPAALSFDVTVPVGTRVTPDGQLVFYLQADVVISAGQTSAEGIILATESGTVYNGFLPGQIQSIVDPVDYIGSAANVTASVGGTDKEDDDSFRERIRLSWEAISTAGAKDSYEYWAKTASIDIVDAEAVKTAPGAITVYVLMNGAVASPQMVLDAVSAACSADKHRPLTDSVTVAVAQVKEYDVSLTYYISKIRSTEESSIKTAVSAAVNHFVIAQKTQLGGDLNPDSLRSALLIAGAYRIDLISPVFTELLPQEVAVAGNISVVYGGLL
jgi:phage-related baseplate assembly protein